MLNSLSVECCVIDDTVHLIPFAIAPDGSCACEMPPEKCHLDDSDEDCGAAVLRACLRCREGENPLGGTDLDATAKILGYRSWSALGKKVLPFLVTRRKGADVLKFTPMRREKSYITFTDDKFAAPISDRAEIGRLFKLVAKISIKNREIK